MRVRYIEKGEIDRFDPEHISFFNINTYEDLEKAGTMASSTSENQLITQMEIA
jgi:molybdopterin-guanine dinucleotide biosynthesis protein A